MSRQKASQMQPRLKPKEVAIVTTLTLLVMAPSFFGYTQPSQAYAASSDKWGINKLFPTKTNGQEWYVNMADPRSDSYFRNWNGVSFSKQSDGSWRVSDSQIRLEAWSKPDTKWLNVEITAYYKVTSGNALFQMYTRGGHHTTSNECLGSAYKGRVWENGEVSFVKEVTHPAYTSNRGTVDVTSNTEDRWIGVKMVIWNFNTSKSPTGKGVHMELWMDDNVGTSSLSIKNNWRKVTTVEDIGGWKTSDSDFDSHCGRARDAILTSPGGTSSQNLAAFRTDDATWQFKYLSVREIQPPV